MAANMQGSNGTSNASSSSKCFGDDCASDGTETWWTSYKTLMTIEGLAGLGGAAVVGLIVLAILVWRIRIANAKAGGRYRFPVQLVLQGHNHARSLDQQAADATYRRAFLHICHPVLSARSTSDAAAVEVDKALSEYNGVVGLPTALAFALPSEVLEPGAKILVATFTDAGLGAEVEGHHVAMVPENSAAAEAGLRIGDQIVAMNGEDPHELTPEVLQEQLRRPGSASFRRDDREESKVFVCSRCATGNSIAATCVSFRCFCCQATALVWGFVIAQDAADTKPPRFRVRRRQVWPEKGYPQYQGLAWEKCALSSAIKHSLGFGRACDPPVGCQHHRQVGATCGVAAVNNLITNCNVSCVNAEHMIMLSKALGEAEAAIREGAQTVEEAGEQQDVSELYADSAGGHFDVQTLQIALDEVGFNMWYVPAQKLMKPSTLFERTKGETELAGYVVHRKDPVNPRRDHWFVMRRHGDAKKEFVVVGDGGQKKKVAQKVQYLIQDSLFEKVFDLTSVEAHHFLLHLPPGALFAVSRKPEPEDAPKPEDDCVVENLPS